jgi:hypothetical protein
MTTVDGSPLSQASITLAPAGPSLPAAFRSQGGGNLLPGPDGRFRFAGVAPGVYTLLARAMGGESTGDRSAPSGAQFALETLTVTNDMQGLTLTLRPMPSFAGTVVFEGTTSSAPDLNRLYVTLEPATSATGTAVAATLPGAGTTKVTATPSADGTFRVPFVMPGSYRVSVPVTGSAPGTGWWLRSAIVDGRDVLDTLLEVGASGVSRAELTFTDQHTTLSGRLQSPAGEPATDYFVVVFATDRAGWKPFARRIQLSRPATDGMFVFHDLPAGQYYVAALSDADRDDWQDAAFLAELADAGAVSVMHRDRENTVLNLRFTRP